MRRICCFLIACLTVSACLLYAADFWEKKEFTNWSEKEVSKMLRNSPWAARADVVAGDIHPAEQHAMIMAQASDVNTGYGDDYRFVIRPDYEDPGEWGTNTRENRNMALSGAAMARVIDDYPPVILRWHSSLPIKQAVAILRYKDKAGTSDEAAEIVNRPESSYILGVIGLRWWPWWTVDDRLRNAFKGSASQLIVEGKPPIQPVEVYAEQDGENINLYIAFPRYQNNGPVISMEDKEVEVVIRFGLCMIKKKFKLKDMLYRGKLEL
ncbi:MAG: hypothetical protein JXR49_00565 [Acidobacteria bacterium]|nr:hypothetical protein [Acidobacteriota bacterium]